MNADKFTQLCQHAFGHYWKFRTAIELKVMEIEIDMWLRADAVPAWAANKIVDLVK